MYKSIYDNPDIMKISELLDLFNIEVSLPLEVLDLPIDACFKKSKFIYDNGKYTFKFEPHEIIIDPTNFDEMVIEKYTTIIPEGVYNGFCCYNSKGSVTCIS